MSRDETFEDTKKFVEEDSAFGQHELTLRREWVWKCMRPKDWCYGFYVLIAPGAVIVYGDIGEAVYRMNASKEEEVLDWLKRAARDQHYLMSKIMNREAYRRFYPGDAVLYAEKTPSNNDDRDTFGEDVAAALRDGDLHMHRFYEIAHEHEIYDVPSCEDWAASAFWFACALKKFIELYEADGTKS